METYFATTSHSDAIYSVLQTHSITVFDFLHSSSLRYRSPFLCWFFLFRQTVLYSFGAFLPTQFETLVLIDVRSVEYLPMFCSSIFIQLNYLLHLLGFQNSIHTHTHNTRRQASRPECCRSFAVAISRFLLVNGWPIAGSWKVSIHQFHFLCVYAPKPERREPNSAHTRRKVQCTSSSAFHFVLFNIFATPTAQ